jgi:hypothetical protein
VHLANKNLVAVRRKRLVHACNPAYLVYRPRLYHPFLASKVNEGDDKEARDRSALYQALLQGFSVEMRRALCHLAGKPRPLQTLFISQVAFLRFLEAGAPETDIAFSLRSLFARIGRDALWM